MQVQRHGHRDAQPTHEPTSYPALHDVNIINCEAIALPPFALGEE